MTLCQSFLSPFAFGKLTEQCLVRGLQAQVCLLYLRRQLINFGFHLPRVCAQLFRQFFLFQCLLLEPNELRHVLDTVDNVDDPFIRPKHGRVDGTPEPFFESASLRFRLPDVVFLNCHCVRGLALNHTLQGSSQVADSCG